MRRAIFSFVSFALTRRGSRLTDPLLGTRRRFLWLVEACFFQTFVCSLAAAGSLSPLFLFHAKGELTSRSPFWAFSPRLRAFEQSSRRLPELLDRWSKWARASVL